MGSTKKYNSEETESRNLSVTKKRFSSFLRKLTTVKLEWKVAKMNVDKRRAPKKNLAHLTEPPTIQIAGQSISVKFTEKCFQGVQVF